MGCDTGLVPLARNKRDKCSQNSIADAVGCRKEAPGEAVNDLHSRTGGTVSPCAGQAGEDMLWGWGTREHWHLKARKRDTLGYPLSLSMSKFDERLKAKLHTNCFHKVNGSELNSNEFTQRLHSGMENHESPTHAHIHRACQNKMWSKKKEANIWTNS